MTYCMHPLLTTNNDCITVAGITTTGVTITRITVTSIPLTDFAGAFTVTGFLLIVNAENLPGRYSCRGLQSFHPATSASCLSATAGSGTYSAAHEHLACSCQSTCIAAPWEHQHMAHLHSTVHKIFAKSGRVLAANPILITALWELQYIGQLQIMTNMHHIAKRLWCDLSTTPHALLHPWSTHAWLTCRQ